MHLFVAPLPPSGETDREQPACNPNGVKKPAEYPTTFAGNTGKAWGRAGEDIPREGRGGDGIAGVARETTAFGKEREKTAFDEIWRTADSLRFALH